VPTASHCSPHKTAAHPALSLRQHLDVNVWLLEFQYLMIDRATLERADGGLVQLFTVMDLAGLSMAHFSPKLMKYFNAT
jgi:hypothetical protein